MTNEFGAVEFKSDKKVGGNNSDDVDLTCMEVTPESEWLSCVSLGGWVWYR